VSDDHRGEVRQGSVAPSAPKRGEISDTARALKLWRRLVGLTQRELATLAGINDSTISDYETGKTVPKEETVMRVCAAFDMTAIDLEEAVRFVRWTLSKVRISGDGEPTGEQ
jgi:transcriptional regulator with XRE-family HTH domain